MTIASDRQINAFRGATPEFACAIVAMAGFAVTWFFPPAAGISAVFAVAAFLQVVRHNRDQLAANLTFIVLSITLFILVSNGILWNLFERVSGSLVGEDAATHMWTVQYIALAICAIAMGASLVRDRRPHRRTNMDRLASVLPCPEVYLSTAFLPVFLNLIYYYTSLRGQAYVAIHQAGLGYGKYILFLIFATHASFIRLFSGWKFLQHKHKLILLVAVLLFLYLYVYLLPLRTNLFIFGMYWIYFFGHRMKWWTKVALVVSVILLFSWMAIHRGGMDDSLKQMGLGEGSLDSLSFGLGMADMVPWSYDEVQRNGPRWGATYFEELAHSDQAPSVVYVREKAPAYADAGGGYGFFYIAELLLNFGYWGGLVGACALGMAMQKVTISQRPLVRLIIVPALLGASFPLVRNDFMSTLKLPFYLSISCILLDNLSRHFALLQDLARDSIIRRMRIRPA